MKYLFGLFVLSLAGLLFGQSQEFPKAFLDGTGPGWRELGEADFAGVNGNAETWTWKDGLLTSTGKPIGVMRTKQKFTNVEFVVQWRHLRTAGNSGVFVWVPDEALADLKPDNLPKWGIEVQMLDHGYKEQYEKSSGKTGDWFTTNGDIFAVGNSKLKPFPPEASWHAHRPPHPYPRRSRP